MIESGLPDFEVVTWLGLLAPAGTPREVIAKLNADIIAVLKQPAFVARMAGLGIDTVGNSPEAFAAIIRTDIDKYARAVKVSGATAD